MDLKPYEESTKTEIFEQNNPALWAAKLLQEGREGRIMFSNKRSSLKLEEFANLQTPVSFEMDGCVLAAALKADEEVEVIKQVEKEHGIHDHSF